MAGVKGTRWLLLAAALLAAVSSGGSAIAEQPTSKHIVNTEETDCVEAIFTRAGSVTAIRPLVPEQYELRPGLPERTPLYIFSNSCLVSVDGHPARRTTTTFVTVFVRPVGDPTAPFETLYVLRHATDNPELAARYQAAGMPTEFTPRSTTTEAIDLAAGTVTTSWDFVGAGLDYTVDVTAAHPLSGAVEPAEGAFIHGGRHGTLLLDYDNEAVTGIATISGDISDATAIVSLLHPAASRTVSGPAFQYLRGQWTSTLQLIRG